MSLSDAFARAYRYKRTFPFSRIRDVSRRPPVAGYPDRARASVAVQVAGQRNGSKTCRLVDAG